MAVRRREGRRTDYTWSGIAGSNLGAFTTVAGLTGISTFGVAGTVMRIRGSVMAFLTTAAAANSIKAINCGVIIGTEEQVATGAGAFPSPTSDLDAEWLWWGSLLLARMTTTETESAGLVSQRIEIDSKAMRRVKQGQSINFLTKPVNLAGTESAGGAFNLRVLFGA